MAKIRVYELARELKMDSKSLLAKIKVLGIQVPSHQSTLTLAQIEKIKASLDAEKPKVVVRRRRKAAAASEPKNPEETNEGSSEEASPKQNEESDESVRREPEEDEQQKETFVAEPQSGSSARKQEKIDVNLAGQKEDGLRNSAQQADAGKIKPIEKDLKKKEEAAEKDFAAGEALDTGPVEGGKARLTGAADSVLSSEDQVSLKPSIKPQKGAERSSQAGLNLEKSDEKEKTGGTSTKNVGVVEVGVKVENQLGASDELKKEAPQQLVADPENEAVALADSEDKEAKIKQIKKRSFSGATIVRKATIEESEAIKATEEARQRTSRREDSRGVRVTGIGVSPRMGQGEGTGRDSARMPKKGGRNIAASGEDRQSATGDKNKVTMSASGVELQDQAPSVGRWSRGDRGRNDKDAGSWEEEEKSRFSGAPSNVKKRVSMRDLLDGSESEGPDSGSANGSASRRRRTIYTPSAQNKKKDLKRRKDLKSTMITTPRASYRVVKIEGSNISVGELARQLSVKSSELIKKLMTQGIMATVNQTVDYETAELIATEFGFECKNVELTIADVLGLKEDDEREGFQRAPIITVMGHVDHGKTSILDAIRKSNVAKGESGGITQHIGAYQVKKNNFAFTFLDTPGHAAFSAMRARGAQITDIVVLVVAADDGVMPQTIEAISHAKSAGVPVIVAVNKIDKQNINLDRLYTELSEHGVQTEEWGGDTQFVKVSAIKNEGISELLEAIQLQSEMLELKSPREGRAAGAIVEAHLDKGRGPVATVMVTSGALRIGDFLVAGSVVGKVRAMTDDKGRKIKAALPSTPVEVIGLTEVPISGDAVYAVEDERLGRQAADLRKVQMEAEKGSNSAAASLDDLLGKVNSSDTPQINLVVKADTQGSVEAIVAALNKLNTDKVKNIIVHRGVGGINESDISLSETSEAVVFGFNVRASNVCVDQAEKRGIVIKYFSVIYDLVDTAKNLMAGKLPPIETEVIQGHAEVRNAISVPKIGTIAGSSVTDGKITRSSQLRLIRDDTVIYDGKIASLRRFKDDVKEVMHGYECGISIDGYTDIQVGDVIEAYMIEESAATLEFADV